MRSRGWRLLELTMLPPQLKRAALYSLLGISLVIGACAWIGYGNPLRQVTFSGAGENYDISRAFFIENCGADGRCEFRAQHKRVMHFSFGDGIMGHPGTYEGRGNNPVALLHEAGLKFVPKPDYAVAALKWCTNAEIHQEFRYHGRGFIVPTTDDPLATARCVQEQLPRRFSVSIADPIGRDEEWDLFDPLEDL